MSGFERNSNWRNYRLGFQLRLTQEQSSVDKLQGGPFLKKKAWTNNDLFHGFNLRPACVYLLNRSAS